MGVRPDAGEPSSVGEWVRTMNSTGLDGQNENIKCNKQSENQLQ